MALALTGMKAAPNNDIGEKLSNVTDSEAETLLELLPLAKSKTVELVDFSGTLSKRSADAH